MDVRPIKGCSIVDTEINERTTTSPMKGLLHHPARKIEIRIGGIRHENDKFGGTG